MFSTRFGLPLILLMPVVMAGCGGDEGRMVVKGSLVENGKPFILEESKIKLPPGATAPPPGSQALQVIFIAAEGGERFPAKVDPGTGQFSVDNTNGKGIKPGKYKISVTASFSGPGADYLKGKFTPEKTQIVRDVKPGEEIVIDVAKPQG